MADPALARKPTETAAPSPRGPPTSSIPIPEVQQEPQAEVEDAKIPTPRDPEKERRLKEEEEAKELAEEQKDLGQLPSIDQAEITNLYDHFSSNIYSSFSQVNLLARDLNKETESPEVCIIGKVGCGKSSVLDAFIGYRISVIGKEGASKRPLHVAFFNNPECEKPKITLRRDPRGSLLPGKHDVVIGPENVELLAAEIEKRNVPSEVPIFIKYESKMCLNMNIIDTPGLPEPESGDDDDQSSSEDSDAPDPETRKILSGELQAELAKNAQFIICCLEEPGDGVNKKQMIEFLEKADPKLDKTIFVCTKFRTHLRKLSSTNEANKYLQNNGDGKSFFVSLVHDKISAKMSSPQFREKVVQSERLDLSTLEKMKFDKRYESKIGFFNLRKYLLEAILKRYQDALPEIPRRIETMKKANEANIERVQRERKNLEYRHLREAATSYATDFISCLEKLMVGTLEGNPQQNGQTMEEEKFLLKDDGDWVDANNKVIEVDPKALGIPEWDIKLYGKQQFERLLREFKAVLKNVVMPPVTMDDIAVALGTSHFTDSSQAVSYVWVCSDIAQRKAHEVIRPLIDRLIVRKIFIIKRLVDIADKMISNKKKGEKAKRTAQPSSSAPTRVVGRDKMRETHQTVDIGDYEDYPFFTRNVKELYFNFVDEKVKTCRLRCMDEFYCTRLIYWDVVNMKEVNFDIKNSREESRKLINNLTNIIFLDIRDRITKNVILKVYNFFLGPLQKELGEILEKISYFSDPDLDLLFQTKTTDEKLVVEEGNLKKTLAQLQAKEDLFAEAVSKFKASRRNI